MKEVGMNKEKNGRNYKGNGNVDTRLRLAFMVSKIKNKIKANIKNIIQGTFDSIK